ncbi:MAG: hypothetical protein RLZ62_2118 [Bacteroidota bacterium]|jgi:hypothetical protein
MDHPDTFIRIFFSPAEAQIEKKRTVEKVFDGKTALWASHRYGELFLRRSNSTPL